MRITVRQIDDHLLVKVGDNTFILQSCDWGTLWRIITNPRSFTGTSWVGASDWVSPFIEASSDDDVVTCWIDQLAVSRDTANRLGWPLDPPQILADGIDIYKLGSVYLAVVLWDGAPVWGRPIDIAEALPRLAIGAWYLRELGYLGPIGTVSDTVLTTRPVAIIRYDRLQTHTQWYKR